MDQWWRHGGIGVPDSKSRQKFSKKNDIKIAGYTFRLKNYVRIPPFLSNFLELAPPLNETLIILVLFLSQNVHQKPDEFFLALKIFRK